VMTSSTSSVVRKASDALSVEEGELRTNNATCVSGL
jgi:hypothetical protein